MIKKEMTAEDVIHLYNKLEDLGIKIWIDGGWAVDALLGEQTRPHSDLDIAIQEKDVQKARELLEKKSYRNVERNDKTEWNFVLGDGNGHEIDFHVIVLDDQGDGIYGPAENGEKYPAEALTGNGVIKGQSVQCISAEYIVKFIAPWLHKYPDRYAPAIRSLCEKFGIDYPKEFNRFKKSG